jgi:hypothetical protein
MATKVLLKIQKQLFDIWELRSIEKHDEYDDTLEDMQYFIVLNKTSIGTNYTQVKFKYPTAESRDAELARIELQLEDYEGCIILR